MYLPQVLSIGIAQVPKEVILQKVRGNLLVRDKVCRVKTIFIDEIPQFAARWFVIFEYVVRHLAPPSKHGLPWGGVQVVGTWLCSPCVSLSFFCASFLLSMQLSN